MNLKGKVIWITGASSGIGKALALELSKQGAKLILSSRKEAVLFQVKEQCQNSETVKVLALDLADYTNLGQKADAAIALFGNIDILVNNGGISQRSFAKDTQISVVKQIMDINYLGTVALSQAILPYFIKQGGGQFVVTTSIVGKIGTPLRSAYAASKHALHGFFDSFRAEIHQYNIPVTLVCPGYVNTDVSKNALIGDGSAQKTMDKATLNGLSAEYFAKKMAKAIRTEKEEVYIAGAKEKLAVYVKRFFPKILSIMIRKMDVT